MFVTQSLCQLLNVLKKSHHFMWSFRQNFHKITKTVFLAPGEMFKPSNETHVAIPTAVAALAEERGKKRRVRATVFLFSSRNPEDCVWIVMSPRFRQGRRPLNLFQSARRRNDSIFRFSGPSPRSGNGRRDRKRPESRRSAFGAVRCELKGIRDFLKTCNYYFDNKSMQLTWKINTYYKW